MKIRTFTLLISTFLSFTATFAQTPTSSEIYVNLRKFGSLKKVLYIAAHPDDENTRFLAWMSLGEKAETAYLSLTRGDGGQNLIGNELGPDLGVLRTQELLAARSYDHAKQYFSRAVDFGFSKSAEESLQKWGKETILSDVVLMIRKFRPDVIITRFPPDERAGHGHHIASAMLAIEAFEKAADPDFLPEQVKEYGTWQTTSIYWNASNWWNENIDQEARDNPDYLIKDIGTYSSLLGKSYNEIGTIARSQHKCQGFGGILDRGSSLEYFQYLAGTRLKSDFFEQNQQSWKKVLNAKFEEQLNTLFRNFDFVNTEKNIPALLTLRKELDKLPATKPADKLFKQEKISQCDQLIADCLGLYTEILGQNYALGQGKETTADLNIINRSQVPVYLTGIDGKTRSELLPENKIFTEPLHFTNNEPLTNPYWLREPFTNVYTVTDPVNLLRAENDPTFMHTIELTVQGTAFNLRVPVQFKWRDPSYGERIREVISVPDYSVNFGDQAVILRAGQTRSITLDVRSFKTDLNDTIHIECPAGWTLNRQQVPVSISNENEHQLIELNLTAQPDSKRGTIVLRDSKGNLLHAFTEIAYDHIPTQVIFRPAELACVKIDAEIIPGKVAYIRGVQDAVPQAIAQLGFDVQVFEVSDLATLDLSAFESVVLGIRIYNVHSDLHNYTDKLFSYVNGGGNLVMQYNTASRFSDGQLYGGPLPFEISRDRVTEEDASVTFLQPQNAIMTTPNKLTQADFENWVQERGLYFAANWNEAYTPLFAWNDQGEDARTGALIAAQYGKGRVIYTGISFFRELPAGVEGAYRLFANLVSYEP